MSDALDEATRALRDAPTPAGPPAELTAATAAALKERLAGTRPAGEVSRQRRRRLMRYAGYAAVTSATIAVGVAALLMLAGPSAAAKVEKAMGEVAKAKSFRIVRKVGTATEFVVTVQGDTFRLEWPGKRALVVDMKSRKVLELDLVAKTARRTKLEDGEERELSRQLAQARDFLGTYKREKAEVKELPGEKVGDRDTRVYAIRLTTKDGKGNVIDVKRTLWLDKKTELPVRFRNHKPSGDIDAEFDSWNEKFDDKLFSLEVPEGYKLVDEKK